MQNTSNMQTAEGFFEAIDLPKDFPVTRPGFHTPPTLAHVHNCFEIGLCSAGAGIFIVADKIFSCSAGDVIFINSKEFHALKNASPLNSDWKFINLDPAALLAGWLPPEEHPLDVSRLSGREFMNVAHEKEHPDIVSAVRRLIDELERQADDYRSMVRSLVWGLLIMLKRLAPKESNAPESPDEIQRIYPALRQISSHYSQNVEIPQLAELCSCSVSTFRRIFQRSLGCSPIEYLKNFRLKAAAAMLESTDHSIMEIALISGFATLSNFNRQFKVKFLQSPRDYRKKFTARKKAH